jgi:hypothetical protein
VWETIKETRRHNRHSKGETESNHQSAYRKISEGPKDHQAESKLFTRPTR